jgi:hypothetical protein
MRKHIKDQKKNRKIKTSHSQTVGVKPWFTGYGITQQKL